MRHRFVLALALVLAGCGGGPTTDVPDAFVPADGGRDAAISIDSASLDANVQADTATADGGSDAFSTLDASHDAFANDAAVAHVTAACAVGVLHAATSPDFALPTYSATVGGGLSYTQCVVANETSTPKVCEVETMWSGATLSAGIGSSTDIHITGTLPLRIADIALSACTSTTQYAFNGDGSCPGGTFGHLPVDIDITVGASPGFDLTVNHATASANASAALTSGMQLCSSTACTGSCCASGTHPSTTTVVSSVLPTIEAGLVAEIEAALCQSTACPASSPADTNGICRNTDGSCIPGPAFYGC